MGKRVEKGVRPAGTQISWQRLRAIFNDPQPPVRIWERQFDGFDDELRRLAATPYEQMDFGDLWYYHHDLAYVELQLDLFRYLFPACLMDWHLTLQANQPCSHGDSEFHYGVQSGEVFTKMLSPLQQQEVYQVLRDSFLQRLDNERDFACTGANSPAHGWIFRFNSLGLIMPRIDLLWEPWWSLETPGRAVAALEYCSGLMYPEGHNPLFGQWTAERGGGGPYLWENDGHIFDAGWMQENVEFLAKTLTVNFVVERIEQAVEKLRDQPEVEQAQQIAAHLYGNQRGTPAKDLIELRVAELPSLLTSAHSASGWTV